MALITCSSASSSPWLPLFLFFLCVFSIPFFSSAEKIPYAPHCNSTTPEVESTNRFTTSRYAFSVSNGYFSGGANLFHWKDSSFNFRVIYLYKTQSPDILRVDGELVLSGVKIEILVLAELDLAELLSSFDFWIDSRDSNTEQTRFHFSGFWSKSTGMLCMVGHGTFTQAEGKSLPLSAVFKLFYPQNSTVFTSLCKGTLESLSNSSDALHHFDPIILLAYKPYNYNFTMKSQAERSCSPLPELENSMSFDSDSICNILRYLAYHPFKLDYESSCSGDRSKCRTLEANLGFSARFVYFDMVQCIEVGKLQLLIEFSNTSRRGYDRAMVPEKSLVGEGHWDHTKNRLCLVACHIHNETSLTAPSVRDCSIGLSLIFPSVITLKNRSDIIGQMWSNKNKDDTGYSSKVSFQSWRHPWFTTPSYNYTEMDFVSKNCRAVRGLHSTELVYPDVYHLNFNALFNHSAGKIGRGILKTISVGDELFDHGAIVVMSASSPTQDEESTSTLNKRSLNKDVNVSCSITYYFFSRFSGYEEFKVAAEGVYSSATGTLCMRGCQYPKLDSENHMPMDCDILINIQYHPLNPKAKDQGINGTIRSTRHESDPRYFKPITMLHHPREIEMDTDKIMISLTFPDTVMVLISLTFLCACRWLLDFISIW